MIDPALAADVATARDAFGSEEVVGEILVRSFTGEELREKDGGPSPVGHRQ